METQEGEGKGEGRRRAVVITPKDRKEAPIAQIIEYFFV